MKEKKKGDSFTKIWNNLAYMWVNGILATLPESFSNKISPQSHLKKIQLILKDFVADFLRLFKETKIPEDRIWFLVLTKNNVTALKGIKKSFPNAIYVSFFRFRSTAIDSAHFFYLKNRFFYDLIYPFKWLRYYFFEKKKALRYYDLFFTVNGSYEECLRVLKKCKPKAIVFTNDHLVISRALLLAANDLKIQSYYVQHASVTEFFPPLEFTHAMLDGKDAYLKYKKTGEIKSEVHLVGISKFDDYVKESNTKDRVQAIGVAYNLTDEIEEVHGFITNLRNQNLESQIILRAHPADKRSFPDIKNVSVSNSLKENAFEFIKKIDCLISGDSSIHLEAVLLNVYPLYYNFGESKRFDFYGYVKNEMVEHFSSFESLNNKLNDLKKAKPNVQKRAVYYNAAVGTDFYGKSTDKIVKIISDTLKPIDDKE